MLMVEKAEDLSIDELSKLKPSDLINEWATEHARLLLIACIVLGLPWFISCYGIALMLARGSCGGG